MLQIESYNIAKKHSLKVSLYFTCCDLKWLLLFGIAIALHAFHHFSLTQQPICYQKVALEDYPTWILAHVIAVNDKVDVDFRVSPRWMWRVPSDAVITDICPVDGRIDTVSLPSNRLFGTPFHLPSLQHWVRTYHHTDVVNRTWTVNNHTDGGGKSCSHEPCRSLYHFLQNDFFMAECGDDVLHQRHFLPTNFLQESPLVVVNLGVLVLLLMEYFGPTLFANSGHGLYYRMQEHLNRLRCTEFLKDPQNGPLLFTRFARFSFLICFFFKKHTVNRFDNLTSDWSVE